MYSDSDHLLLLMEMFPDYTKVDIIKTLEAHKGDMDLCIQALLETSNSDQKQPLTEIERKSPSTCLRRDLLSMKDDDHLKYTILSKWDTARSLHVHMYLCSISANNYCTLELSVNFSSS